MLPLSCNIAPNFCATSKFFKLLKPKTSEYGQLFTEYLSPLSPKVILIFSLYNDFTNNIGANPMAQIGL